MKEVEKLISEKKGITGVSTGYQDIDKMLLGMQKGDLIVLAARPSMGKTSLALNIAEHVALGARHQPVRPVAVFSLEMSAESLVRRMICGHARVARRRACPRATWASRNTASLMGAADALIRAPIYVDDTAGLEAMDLRARARRMKRKYDVEFIVVDYLQLMNFSKFANEGRQRETAAISQALKGMAKELKVPVLVLSQLSRAPETREKTAMPKLSDLRDSGAIEQDADVVMLLRRPCKYKSDPEASDLRLSILDIAKHRNGPTGEVRLNFEESFTRFENRIEDVDSGGRMNGRTDMGKRWICWAAVAFLGAAMAARAAPIRDIRVAPVGERAGQRGAGAGAGERPGGPGTGPGRAVGGYPVAAAFGRLFVCGGPGGANGGRDRPGASGSGWQGGRRSAS